jgi:hypothetical protein
MASNQAISQLTLKKKTIRTVGNGNEIKRDKAIKSNKEENNAK